MFKIANRDRFRMRAEIEWQDLTRLIDIFLNIVLL